MEGYEPKICSQLTIFEMHLPLNDDVEVNHNCFVIFFSSTAYRRQLVNSANIQMDEMEPVTKAQRSTGLWVEEATFRSSTNSVIYRPTTD